MDALNLKRLAAGLGLMAAAGLLVGAAENDPKGAFGQVTAAWVQAVGSVAAILAAIAVASRQARDQAKRDLDADRAYVAGAVAAVEHAEAAMSQVEADVGGDKWVERGAVAISPCIHMLDSVEQTITSLRLTNAPSEKIARALIAAQFHVRIVSGNLRAFLADDHNTRMQGSYADEQAELLKAAIELRAEHARLSSL